MSLLKKDDANNVPPAEVKGRLRISIIWIVPVLAAIAAAWLVFQNVRQAGPHISILFKDGSGLQGNQTVLRYRGVKVGEVSSVKLSKDAQHVEVEARLDESAASLAREGSQFWVVRPEVGASGLSGLETIVSGPFIQVQPGSGKEKKKFTGVEQPPVLKPFADGLEIVVTTPDLRTLSVGSPVYYRGVTVGTVWYIVLNEDSTTVNVHLLIQTNYAALVREDSIFWNAGGIDVDLKLFGINISAQTFKSLIVGAIAFATPSNPGAVAAAGSTFPLYEKADDKWLKWSPTIQITNSQVKTPENISSPAALLNDMNQAPKQ